jgi:Trypsin-like serine proteases, typically periplasmic, contain C-terminal PDZ domain
MYPPIRAIPFPVLGLHAAGGISDSKEGPMDSLLTLSNELAAAVEHAGRAVFGINARPRLGSAGVHWRPGLIVTADHTVQMGRGGHGHAPRRAGRHRDGRRSRPYDRHRHPEGRRPDVAVAEVGDSDAVRVGHIVLAVGPGPRASWGVVSAVGSGRDARSAAGELLNLDLTLYPGFSGGPLVDVQGRVVGVNTSGASRQLQLAIPAAAVNRVLDELGRRGRIPRAYLGVGTQQVRLPEGIRQRFSLDQQTAVIVVDVQPNSPAAGAGLLIGDIIVSLGGTSITEPAELKSVLRPDRVGRKYDRIGDSRWRAARPPDTCWRATAPLLTHDDRSRGPGGASSPSHGRGE